MSEVIRTFYGEKELLQIEFCIEAVHILNANRFQLFFTIGEFRAQLPEAVEYTDYISTVGKDSLNEGPAYDTKPSDC